MKSRALVSIILLTAIVVALNFSLSRDGGDTTRGNDENVPARILVVGDMMFDRTMRTLAETKGYDHLFSCMTDYMNTFDAVVGNLEGPVTAYDSVSKGTKPGEEGNTRFTFSPESVVALKNSNVSIVNLGNNHIRDFGREGEMDTMVILDAAGIKHFGAPSGSAGVLYEVSGKRISFVSYNQFIEGGSSDRTIKAIKEFKQKSDYVIVYTHWGEEYVKERDFERALAHSFIDVGADMVIGAHPHVIQGEEEKDGKPIYYSLGNFVFDQYWNESVRTGLVLELEFGDEGLIVKQNKVISSRDGRVCLE